MKKKFVLTGTVCVSIVINADDMDWEGAYALLDGAVGSLESSGNLRIGEVDTDSLRIDESECASWEDGQ